MNEELLTICDALVNYHEYKESAKNYVFPESVRFANGGVCFLAMADEGKRLVSAGGELPAMFYGKLLREKDIPVKLSRLDVENAEVLLELFPDLRPQAAKGTKPITLGLGDRLGNATPGQLRALKGRNVFPILAQQSMRELELTRRTYEEVIASAIYGVFETGWTEGWGGDGDHLKTAGEVAYALDCGMTMITLDCIKELNPDADSYSDEKTQEEYLKLPQEVRKEWEALPDVIDIWGEKVIVSPNDKKRITLVYYKAIDHVDQIYHEVIEPDYDIDLEISIDETTTTTRPEAHYYIAKLLTDRGVEIQSIAPRFPGEFQKAIDYIGDIAEFDREFQKHVAIAKHFGYRVSVHSGSDKLSVYPSIGKYSEGSFHLKTAGTSWLEALRLIAVKAPKLFRELLNFSIEKLPETTAYYVVSANADCLIPESKVPDDRLPEYLNHPDARQILHIAYGVILCAEKETGAVRFKNEIMALLEKYQDEYYAMLEKHFNEHLDALGI